MRVDPMTQLKWVADVAADKLVPGNYVFEIECLTTDEEGRAIGRTPGRFSFVLRAATPEAMPDIRLRAAARAMLGEHYSDAKDELRALLAVHPHSVIAYGLMGDIHLAENNKPQALLDYRRAQAELAAHGDTLLLQFTNQRDLVDINQGLSERIERAQK
jgi:predicted Zn-dependent protease